MGFRGNTLLLRWCKLQMWLRGDEGRVLPAAGEGGAGAQRAGRDHPVLQPHAVRRDAGGRGAGEARL